MIERKNARRLAVCLVAGMMVTGATTIAQDAPDTAAMLKDLLAQVASLAAGQSDIAQKQAALEKGLQTVAAAVPQPTAESRAEELEKSWEAQCKSLRLSYKGVTITQGTPRTVTVSCSK